MIAAVLYEKISISSESGNPTERGYYDTSSGYLFYIPEENRWHDSYRTKYPSYWYKPISEKSFEEEIQSAYYEGHKNTLMDIVKGSYLIKTMSDWFKEKYPLL